MKFSDKINQLMIIKNVSAYKIHKATGISQNTLSRWRSGETGAKGDNLQKLADYLKVPMEYLVNDDLDSIDAITNDKKNSPPLNDEEIELLGVYRQLTKGGRKRMIGFGYDEIDRMKQEQSAIVQTEKSAG